MHKAFLVARHAYLEAVKKKSFLIATLGLPLLLVVVMVIAIVVQLSGSSKLPLGYVDHTGLFDPALWDRVERPPQVELVRFSETSEAQAALEAQEIQAYYVIPKDYLEAPLLELYYWETGPGELVVASFEGFMQFNLILQAPATARTRLLRGADLTIRSLDGRRQVGGDSFLNMILPFAAGFAFYFVVMSAGGYMLQAVTNEKENRTIEVLATSLSPEQLIGGKAVGLMAVVLTQLLLWGGVLVLVGLVGARYFPILYTLEMPWDLIGLVLLFFLPSYLLVASVMTAVGSVVVDQQQGQQIAGLLNMPFIFPLFFVGLIMTNPNSPMLVALTLFPTTSFITLTMRWGFTAVPLWQMGVSWVLTVGAAALSVWLAARLFRIGMLQYGQRLKLKNIVAALREGH